MMRDDDGSRFVLPQAIVESGRCELPPSIICRAGRRSCARTYDVMILAEPRTLARHPDLVDRSVVARFDLAKNDLDRPVDSCLDHKCLFGAGHCQTEILRRPPLVRKAVANISLSPPIVLVAPPVRHVALLSPRLLASMCCVHRS